MPLVFGWASSANRHGALASNYRRLLSQLALAGDYDDAQLLQFKAHLLGIEADEQASLGALVLLCQNEQAVAQGHSDKVVPLTFIQRLTMHVFDWQIVPK